MKMPAIALSSLLLLTACGDGGGASEAGTSPDGPYASVPNDAGFSDPRTDADTEPTPDAQSSPDATPSPDATANVGAGRCVYTNPFSRSPECKTYLGSGWTPTSAAEDCAAVLPGTVGEFSAEGECVFEVVLGTCQVDEPAESSYRLLLGGTAPDDSSGCALAQTGCEAFARGTFTGAGPCEGGGNPIEPPPVPGGVFIPPFESCTEPVEGEPPGSGPDGKVCTFNAISACTEPGRRFEDYASCEVVLSQRPYYPVPPVKVAAADDPRLLDPAYMGEMAWVTEQAAACGCTCCHSERASPSGASIWSIDESPLWLDHLSDGGLALLAGLADSSVLGAYPAAQNKGFARDVTGLPTTDPERMQAFLVNEWLRRGLALEDAEEIPPFGGPIYDQQVFEPSPCRSGQGVGADGAVTWSGGGARYVYVLSRGSKNPGVPPNLDLPEGTIWRLDVPPDGPPVESGVRYGQAPPGASQRFPAAGAPAALVSGETYYLYVLADVGLPITRCVFDAP